MFAGGQLLPWTKKILGQGESCLVFLCGITGSGKSRAALQADYQLQTSTCIFSDDLVFEGHQAVPSHHFISTLETIAGRHQPTAIICDDINAELRCVRYPDFQCCGMLRASSTISGIRARSIVGCRLLGASCCAQVQQLVWDRAPGTVNQKWTWWKVVDAAEFETESAQQNRSKMQGVAVAVLLLLAISAKVPGGCLMD